MATTAFCTPAKAAFLRGDLRVADTFKVALYNASATNDATMTGYVPGGGATNEISGTGYTGGGLALTGVATSFGGTTGWWTASNPSWTTATFTANSCIIYDDTDTNGPKRVLCVLDFGGPQAVAAGTFTIQFPVAAAATALLRLL